MLPESVCAQIFGYVQAGKSMAEAARHFKVSPSTVRRAIDRTSTGKFARKNRRCLPAIAHRRRIVTTMATAICKKEHRAWPAFASANAIASELLRRTGIAVTARTICRDLKHAGFVNRVRPHNTTSLPEQVAARKRFARHFHEPVRLVHFSDETWLSCNECTGRCQWTKRKKDLLPIERKARWNTPCCQVWAVIGYNYKSPLIILPTKRANEDGVQVAYRLNSERYIRQCLSKVRGRFENSHRILQQDGARCHTAGATQLYLQGKGIRYIHDWPAYSADLNVIEQLWPHLKKEVGRRCPLTLAQLQVAAKEAWDAIPQSLINDLVDSFTAKLRSVMDAVN